MPHLSAVHTIEAQAAVHTIDLYIRRHPQHNIRLAREPAPPKPVGSWLASRGRGCRCLMPKGMAGMSHGQGDGCGKSGKRKADTLLDTPVLTDTAMATNVETAVETTNPITGTAIDPIGPITDTADVPITDTAIDSAIIPVKEDTVVGAAMHKPSKCKWPAGKLKRWTIMDALPEWVA